MTEYLAKAMAIDISINMLSMYSLQIATGVIFSKQPTVRKTLTLITGCEINLNALDIVKTMTEESRKTTCL